jgi:leukotriene-A4 hydrolase
MIMRAPALLLPVAAFLLMAVGACDVAPKTDAEPAAAAAFPDDVHSYARPAEAAVTHVSLDLTPDFTSHRIHGTARLAIRRATGADSVVLDIRDITIRRVSSAAGDSLGFSVGPSQEFIGQPLAIKLPATGDTIVIEYETSPDAGAVQWLAPAQTAGKRLPFLFTQGQAILTRTWVPTQDSPGIRQTYDAIIHVPADMRAVMSAEHIGTEGEKDAEGRAVYRFRMNEAIPPYLIALAVGDLEFRAIGANTGVYAEPSVVARAANEFAEVDQRVAAASRLYGPYRWGRFDILVLPPSFPFGGMENPRLTFATPTVLAATVRSSRWLRMSSPTRGREILLPMRTGMISGSTRDSPRTSRAGSWKSCAVGHTPTCCARLDARTWQLPSRKPAGRRRPIRVCAST